MSITDMLCVLGPPVVLGEVIEDVHLVVFLQKTVGSAHVMALQH